MTTETTETTKTQATSQIKLVSKNPEGFKPWAPQSTIDKYGAVPTLTDAEFIDILVNRSKMGESVHGGEMINTFLKEQIDPEKGDAIILFMSGFDDWHDVISQYTDASE